MRLLWHSGFYDGPLNGMCLFNGQKHWFRLLDEDEQTQERTFEIVQLPDEEIAALEKDHAQFAKHVGTHTEYNELNRRDHNGVRPLEDHHKFYDAEHPSLPVTGSVVKIVTEQELRKIE